MLLLVQASLRQAMVETLLWLLEQVKLIRVEALPSAADPAMALPQEVL